MPKKEAKTFGDWSYDPNDNTITYLPNGYYLHRDDPIYNSPEEWLRHLRAKNWYQPLAGTENDPFLIQAMKYAGWL